MNAPTNARFSAGDRRFREELRATIAAARELGPEYEEQILDSFIERIRPVTPVPVQPSPAVIRHRRGRGRGFLIAAAIVFGWFVLGHGFAGPHYTYRLRPDLPSAIGAPVAPSAPSLPAVPQLPQSAQSIQ